MRMLQSSFTTLVEIDTMLHDIRRLGYRLDLLIGINSVICDIGRSMRVNQVSEEFYVHLYHSPT
jgi:hypothetical protein